jgi:hypothetical protein
VYTTIFQRTPTSYRTINLTLLVKLLENEILHNKTKHYKLERKFVFAACSQCLSTLPASYLNIVVFNIIPIYFRYVNYYYYVYIIRTTRTRIYIIFAYSATGKADVSYFQVPPARSLSVGYSW